MIQETFRKKVDILKYRIFIWVTLRVFPKIYSIGFADNVSTVGQYKGYCLLSNDSDSWKCVLDYRFIWLLIMTFFLFFVFNLRFHLKALEYRDFVEIKKKGVLLIVLNLSKKINKKNDEN